MRKTAFWALVAIISTAATVDAQRNRGQAWRNRWLRPEPIQERVSVYFNDVAGPATAGDKVADLNTIDMVRAAAAAGQVSLLYLHDGKVKDEKTTRQAEQWFESTLFRPDAKTDELATKLRCVHLGRIDVSKDPAIQQRYGEEVPLFIAFDVTGKEIEPVSMPGYKAEPRKLEALLDKASKGVKPSPKSFAKKYARWLEDYEKLLRKKEEAEVEQMKASNKADQIKTLRAVKALEKAESKMLEKEKDMLEDVRMPPRGSVKIGGVPPRGQGGNNGRGNTGEGNTGRGNTGRGNTGEGNTGRGNTGRGNSGRGNSGRGNTGG